METYGSEEKCIEHVKKAKWPNGFIWAQSVYVGGNINEMSKSFQITCVMISTNQHICISSLIAFDNWLWGDLSFQLDLVFKEYKIKL